MVSRRSLGQMVDGDARQTPIRWHVRDGLLAWRLVAQMQEEALATDLQLPPPLVIEVMSRRSLRTLLGAEARGGGDGCGSRLQGLLPKRSAAALLRASAAVGRIGAKLAEGRARPRPAIVADSGLCPRLDAIALVRAFARGVRQGQGGEEDGAKKGGRLRWHAGHVSTAPRSAIIHTHAARSHVTTREQDVRRGRADDGGGPPCNHVVVLPRRR